MWRTQVVKKQSVSEVSESAVALLYLKSVQSPTVWQPASSHFCENQDTNFYDKERYHYNSPIQIQFQQGITICLSRKTSFCISTSVLKTLLEQACFQTAAEVHCRVSSTD